ncbi:N-6 DNA methylase [[Haemophilus] felis]|uniref:site-specific DNA-methyltransferase (adenine-specific) n=1 Tax=[Haemophilus] felis TaxID=123822 RepID=A0A1T0AXY1_9PAST|nr:N-6 DNA methylase [[Haemophilus] felis]NBI41619.1 N-6 DNA methylase [[Haemophilus] felis]OOS02800.1 restriction endonuclease subunit M [[Haemophilus] felis]
MNNLEQQYLNELDAKLWKSADKLRSNMDAANYKHVILSLIFLKYVSDAFLARQQSIQQQLTDPDHLYYLDPSFYDSEDEYQQALANELEQLDYYTEENVFWVPKTARWDELKAKATTPVGTVLWQNEKGEEVKMRNVSWLVDLALETIEKSNPKLKNILSRISQYQVEDHRLIDLISLFSDTSFANPEYQGKKHADSFTEDQHPDLRADFVMANPPFNLKEWWHKSLENDARWQYGTPPEGNANFAWMQHMLYHLAPMGSIALLLANGSMSSNTGGEGEIRKRLIEEDVVECMVALPGQLFTNTQIPACIWFLSKDKKNGVSFDKKKRNRSGEVLFIDARQLGYMKDRVLRDFTEADSQKIVQTFHNWQYGEDYQNEAGFCYSATLADIQKQNYILTPGRYVGAVAQEKDSEPFAEKMQKLTALLNQQMAEGERLNAEIKMNLAGLGYE